MPKLTVWRRFKAQTPPFFKRLQALGLTLVTVGEGLLQISYMPPSITTKLQMMVCIGGTIAFISQFAVHDQQAKPTK